MKKNSVDVVYVVASKLGSIGMGSTSYYAVKSLDESKDLSYKVFCRGYEKNLGLMKKNIQSYGYLELLSLPLRAIQKKLKINFNPFILINNLFSTKVKNHLPECKIYHTWFGIGLEALKKAKNQGAILILEGANSHPLHSLNILNEEFKLLNKKNLVIKKESIKDQVDILSLFDYVMCPSEFVYNSYLQNGFKKSQLIKTSYGVDIEKFKLRKKKHKMFRVVFVGSLQVRKGLHYLLKAWDELNLKNAELVLVGRIWPDLHDIAEPYKKNKSIRFVGFHKNPHNFLKNADVFISPSLEEGSALTCYEAMATGLPIIATKNTGSVARNNKDGFIIPIRDVNILKEKIKYLYDHQNICKKMGLSARKQVENYTWKKYGEKQVQIYKNLIKKHHSKK